MVGEVTKDTGSVEVQASEAIALEEQSSAN
jgi:hypothetical protein